MGQTCSACKVIFDGSEKSGIHHPTRRALAQSGFTGCTLCSFLWDNLTEEERERIRKYDERSNAPAEPEKVVGLSNSMTAYSIVERNNSDEYCLTYKFLDKCLEDDQLGIVKTFSFLSEKLAGDLGPEGYTKPALTRSALALKWISECEKSHPNCKATGKKDFLPNRLIDVGVESSVNPSLCITADRPDLPVGTKYVTLSHCWGSIEIKKLETGNLKDMKEAIIMSSLPKTFQDAIRVTRELGIQYLWIDSLCIIQDSREDWFKESNLMGYIYSNSYCTISATAAQDGSMGLFLDRKLPVANPTLCVSANWDGQGHKKYYEYAGTLNKEAEVDRDTGMWTREVDSAPLNTRAWVLQERFLSRRNLMFTRNDMFWECADNRACDAFPDRLPVWISSPDFKISSEAALAKLAPHGAKEKEEDRGKATDWIAKRAWFLSVTGAQVPLSFEGNNGNFANGGEGTPNAYRYWSTLVEHYSQKILTKESDRLIALYGIAQWIKQQYTHDEYIAGMWKDHLLNQLLWMTYKNLKKRRPTAYRAPTWSWASVIGKLMFRDILEAEELDKIARVVDVKVHTVEGKEGQVTGGYLKIHGKIITGTWSTGFGKGVSDIKEEEEATSWDGATTANPTNTFSMKMGNGRHLDILIGYPDVEEDGFQGGETVCLAIQKRETQEKSDSDKAWSLVLEGLVLVRYGSDTYRRIGFFNSSGDGARHFLERSTETVVEII